VRGFVEPIARELPMEYALELNRLIELQMEGRSANNGPPGAPRAWRPLPRPHERQPYDPADFPGCKLNARCNRWRAACILEVMKPARAASRRFLPTSPFSPPSIAPAEQFAVRDQVTHDTYGLGRVIGVEDDTALVVNFGSCRVRIMTPCAKLTKL